MYLFKSYTCTRLGIVLSLLCEEIELRELVQGVPYLMGPSPVDLALVKPHSQRPMLYHSAAPPSTIPQTSSAAQTHQKLMARTNVP